MNVANQKNEQKRSVAPAGLYGRFVFNTVSFTSLHSRLIECRPCGTSGKYYQPCKGDTLLTAGFNLRYRKITTKTKIY